MKVAIFFSCLIALSVAAPYSHTNVFDLQELRGCNNISESIENILNGFIGDLHKYDPVDIDQISFNFLERTVVFKGIHAENFSIIVPNLCIEVGLFSTKLDIKLSLTKVSASVESWESDLPLLFGKGEAGVDIHNLEVSLNIIYDYFQGVSPSKVVTSIRNAEAYVTGVHYNEELSQKITDLLNYLLNTYVNSEEFHGMLGQFLDNVINSILSGILGKH